MRADRTGCVEDQHDGPYAAGHRSRVGAGCSNGLKRHRVVCVARHGSWRLHPQRGRPVVGVQRGEGGGRDVVKVGPLGRLFEPGSQPAVEAEPPEQPSPCPEPVPCRLGLYGLFAAIVLERGAVAAVLYGITHVGAGQVVVQLGPGMQIARYRRRRGAARTAPRPDWRQDMRRPAGGPPGAARGATVSGGAGRRWRYRIVCRGGIPSTIAHGSGLPACRISRAAGDERQPCGRSVLSHPASRPGLRRRLPCHAPAGCGGRGARRECR